MKWNVFSTHIKTAFTPKSLCNISVKYKVIPSGCPLGIVCNYIPPLSDLQG